MADAFRDASLFGFQFERRMSRALFRSLATSKTCLFETSIGSGRYRPPRFKSVQSGVATRLIDARICTLVGGISRIPDQAQVPMLASGGE
jgi:hypothetical protein